MRITSLFARLRGPVQYAIAWTPLVLVYFAGILATSALGVGDALGAALRTVGYAALLGVGVIWGARRWPWPSQLRVPFLLAHLSGAVLYGVLWVSLVFGSLWLALDSWRDAWTQVSSWWGWQVFFGTLLYWIIAALTWASVAARESRERARALAEAEALRTRAELSALRGQLDPHFLFNTLHSVAALTKRDPDLAAEAIERLGDLLRYVLDANRGARDTVLLADELAFIDAYLALEGLRLGERLRVERQIDAQALSHRVPSLVLQPLVENAIRYAIAPRPEGGRLQLRGRVRDHTLELEVADDGPGSDAAVAGGTGIGLQTVRERLRALFGPASTLAVETAPQAGFRVRIRIPS